ncbi:hypothetical protein [Lentibacillus saliphilus]|uniref:hypothetical protein n=1 Tax=Lentibacillus saliphilus TaxID=2737028 RepID=UPI001C300550|nr:hypothetical protein [Lentibacillus saliphilus]
MDYQMFYAEVVSWISDCNSMAVKHGMESDEFWTWAMRSTGELSDKYGNNDLVKKQMIMLLDWLNDIYEKAR